VSGEYRIPGIGTRLRQEGLLGGLPRLGGWGLRYASGLPATLTGTRRTFGFAGEQHRYLVHRHNFTWLHERAVEVPIARAAVDREPGRVLEIGHVLGHYGVTGQDVVDKYEQAPGVRNVDVLDLEPAGHDLVVSVSTIEHVGIDDAPQDPARAVAAARRLRELGGRVLATVPVGYNPALDEAIRGGAAGFDEVRALVRDGGGMRWREASADEAWALPYDRLLYRARAVLVCRTTP
jgi:hypothetical protein